MKFFVRADVAAMVACVVPDVAVVALFTVETIRPPQARSSGIFIDDFTTSHVSTRLYM